jgi:ABC-type cobalamin transport system permease subunit
LVLTFAVGRVTVGLSFRAAITFSDGVIPHARSSTGRKFIDYPSISGVALIGTVVATTTIASTGTPIGKVTGSCALGKYRISDENFCKGIFNEKLIGSNGE